MDLHSNNKSSNSLAVGMPEAQWMVYRPKSKVTSDADDDDSSDDVKIGHLSFSSKRKIENGRGNPPKPRPSPCEEDKKFTLTVQYRTQLPRVTIHVDQPNGTARTPREKLDGPLNIISTAPVIATDNHKCATTKLPAVLIAKLLTSQGTSSYFPQLFPSFKDASLMPSPKPSRATPEVSNFWRSHLAPDDRAESSNRIVLESSISQSTSSSPLTAPSHSVTSTHSLIFPKRYKRKSWRRTAKI